MQPSRIHHVGLPVTDLDLSVAWYREALGLTHELAAGVPGVSPSWLRDRRAARTARGGSEPPPGTTRSWRYARVSPIQPGQSTTSTPPTRVRWRRAAARSGRPATRPSPDSRTAFVADPDGNLVELLSRDGEAPPTSGDPYLRPGKVVASRADSSSSIGQTIRGVSDHSLLRDRAPVAKGAAP